MKKNKDVVEIVVVLDSSGSMQIIKNDTIGSFNSFLSSQKELEGKANLTLITFSDKTAVIKEGIDIKEVSPLNTETYQPHGGTALLDALGTTFNNLELKSPKKAIVCVITDGEENSSKEWKFDQIKHKTKAAEARGWQVLYLGANQDAFKVSRGLGISQFNTAAYYSDPMGIRNAGLAMNVATQNYRGGVSGQSLQATYDALIGEKERSDK